MPLVKLWNCLFGKSQPTESTRPDPAGDKTSQRSEAAANPSVPSDLAFNPNEAPTRRRIFDFVSGGPHASLCRMIKKSNPDAVLEVGVGDGSRATAVLSTLAKSRPAAEIRYIAIDLFEMGDQPLTLKGFHQQIRSIDVRPHLLPMPFPQGLTRVAHTFGTVDLVLLADPSLKGSDPLVARVTHPESVILQWDGQNWQQIQGKNAGPSRHQEAA
jgi:hypothetical protein